jgi:hypothetical protein
MGERISGREFARREQCRVTQVQRAIAAGRLERDADGLLDASLVGTAWRNVNRRTARKRELEIQKAAPPVHPMMIDAAADEVTGPNVQHVAPDPEHETVAQAVARIANASAPHTRAEAERIKENYYALLRELEYQIKTGQVVELEVVETEFYNAARTARDAWLNWPMTAGPILAADLGLEADRVTEALTELVHAHITRLGNAEPVFAQRQS